MPSLPHSPPGRLARVVSVHAFQSWLIAIIVPRLACSPGLFLFSFLFFSGLRSSGSLNLGLLELGYARVPHLVWVTLWLQPAICD